MTDRSKETNSERSQWSGLAILPTGFCAYSPTWALQREIAARRARLELPDTLLIVQHQPVITLGLHGSEKHLRLPDPTTEATPEVVRIDRGGEATYHGPGQLTAYLITDLRTHRLGVRQFMATLEEVVIQTLADFGIQSYRRPGLIGIWTEQDGTAAKVAAAGVRVTRGISTHGIALNVTDCMSGFDLMVPCGLTGEAVTTMEAKLGSPVEIDQVSARLRQRFSQQFNIDFRVVTTAAIDSENEISSIVDKLSVGALRGARKPAWLKRELPSGKTYAKVSRILQHHHLITVCQEARCPNQQECWNSGTATFMILGDNCSRRCRFCAVGKGEQGPADPLEAKRLAKAASEMNLRHVVVTSVTRDDLPDGGAGAFAEIIQEIRQESAGITIEVLIPDFVGSIPALQRVIEARPDVLNHNVETIPRFYPVVRPGADYNHSLQILRLAAKAGLRAKSGLMVGLGEADHEVRALLTDLAEAGCDHVTIGQYLQPNRNCLPVKRYWTPAEFDSWRRYGLNLGLPYLDAGALVRSSYHAGEALSSH